ncbi:ABC transporter ATP-binding protein [Bacillus sp. TS-2]|nr:ABC transporter ATP-binding protein [Bacillus sp. TS-2]
MRSSIIDFEQVSFSYPKTSELVIDELSFSITEGEFVCFIAPSGTGKSTLFRLMTSLESPISGTISFRNQPIAEGMKKIGYMPQRDLLLEWRTILDNAALPLELQGINKKKARKMASSYLEEFQLHQHSHKYPHQLSGGMRQRVSFLRAMLSGKDLLLLDEPFSALDAMTRMTMHEWLLQMWKKWKLTIIFVTHDIDEALLLADRVFIFSKKPLSSYNQCVIKEPRPRQIKNELFEWKQQIVQQLTEAPPIHSLVKEKLF